MNADALMEKGSRDSLCIVLPLQMWAGICHPLSVAQSFCFVIEDNLARVLITPASLGMIDASTWEEFWRVAEGF